MTIHPTMLSLLLLLTLPEISCGQAKRPVINYFGIQGPITIQKNTYRLAWTSHPTPAHYMQEYLTVGDGFPKYKSMVTVDFLLGELNLDAAVASKIRDLEALKKTNPVVQYNVLTNDASDEQIIDCLIVTDEQENLAERDVYRYKVIRTKSGKRGMLLLMVSDRKYGAAIMPFLTQLKADKNLLISEVAKLPMPAIGL